MTRIATILLGAALAASSSSAAQILQDRNLEILSLRTEICMRDGTRALAKQGVTNTVEIQKFTLRTCAGPLYGYLIKEKRWPESDAGDYLVWKSLQAIFDAIRDSIL